MIEVRQTDSFVKWLKALRDVNARARIVNRIRRLALGHGEDLGKGRGDLTCLSR